MYTHTHPHGVIWMRHDAAGQLGSRELFVQDTSQLTIKSPPRPQTSYRPFAKSSRQGGLGCRNYMKPVSYWSSLWRCWEPVWYICLATQFLLNVPSIMLEDAEFTATYDTGLNQYFSRIPTQNYCASSTAFEGVLKRSCTDFQIVWMDF